MLFRSGEFDEIREIVLGPEATLSFELPAASFDQKIFYGFYHAETGRSLLLNVHNIYEAFPEFTVTADKQLYRAGETVQVNIATIEGGWLAIAGPGDFHRFEEIGTGQGYAIPLPASLPTGTYSIWVAFADRTTEYRIDVLGADVRFVAGTLDQTRYQNGAPFRLDVLLTSREPFTGKADLELVRPDGTVLPVESRQVTLAAGENRLAFAGVVQTELVGAHGFRIRILDGETVVSRQSFAFLCGQVELLTVETDRREYFRGDETVGGAINLYGEGGGQVEVLLDGTAVTAIPATVDGAATVPFVLETAQLSPGPHTIEAVYSGTGVRSGKVSASFIYGTGLPDLRVVDLEIGKERTAEGALPVTVTEIGRASWRERV